MQWQHGTYSKNANGSLTLEPYAVDGRQLLSSPCEHKNAIYTRYNQPELIQVCRLRVAQFACCALLEQQLTHSLAALSNLHGSVQQRQTFGFIPI